MSLARNQIYRLLTILIILISFTPPSLVSKGAECAIADSQMIFPGGRASVREVDAERIREILEDKAAAEKLRGFGLSKEEVVSKMAKMTHGQIHQLASLYDRITAGGGLLSSLFVIVFIVVLALVLILVVAAA